MTERLTVVSGCMFAGKTDELIRLVERQEFAGRKVQIFKPKLDNRWGKSEKVRSHNDREKEAFQMLKRNKVNKRKKLKRNINLLEIRNFNRLILENF